MRLGGALAACVVAALAVVPAAVIALTSFAGCSQEPALAPADQVYTVRGRITSLPQPAKPLSELMMLHEPIPPFVGKDGAVVGMDSMEMPFTPAKSLSLQGLATGDVVEFTFEVRWKARPFSRVTRITKLPAGTELRLGPASGGH